MFAPGKVGHVYTNIEGRLDFDLSICIGSVEDKRGICSLWMFKFLGKCENFQ